MLHHALRAPGADGFVYDVAHKAAFVVHATESNFVARSLDDLLPLLARFH
jgi:hypothetical protein